MIRRIALTLGLALLAAPALAQTTIDTFAEAQGQLQSAAACSPTSCSTVGGAMIGTERDIRTRLFAGSGVATAEVSGGAFLFNGIGTAFAEARLVWDGVDGNADLTAFSGLAGVNLTTGADSIILDVNSSSAGSVVIIEVFTSASSSSLYTLWLPAVAAPTTFALPFASFVPHLGSGATFSNVGVVTLTVRGPGATLSLNGISAGTGPAPAVAATKTVAISNDLGRSGSAEPGDTLKYTLQIGNKSGKPSSANTALTDTLDANVTLVPGSVEASPIGIEDHYFQGGSTISVVAPGVLGNDVDPDGDAKSVAITGSITTSTGAAATVNANGSFSVPISADGTLDTFTYEVTDGNGITSAAVVTVGFVNQPPVVTTTGGTTAFAEDAGSVVVDSGLTVTDDGTTLASATVTITNLLDGANEVLTALPSGSILAGDISYAAGTLTITRAGGLVSEYQTVLRSVRYNNTSNAPTTTTRSVAFAVNDGFAASNTGTKSVSVTAANDAPVLTAGATLAYTENDAATVIDGTITVNDPDSATLTQATITLTTFQAGQDVLSFTNDGATMGNVAVGTNVGGVLTLSSAGGTATLAQWQAALRAVRYSNSSDNPTTTARTVTWRVNDGAGANNLSNQPTSTINITAVNDTPVLTLVAAGISFTEGNAATTLDSNLTVADVDNTNLAGATVSITANVSSDDVLACPSCAGQGIGVSFASPTLTLTGSATKAAYQTALRSVTYANASQNPTTPTRTISWQLNDGSGVNNLSTIVTSTVAVTAVNDAPVALAKASAVQANMRRNTIDASLLSGVTDVDNGVNGCVSTSFSVANIGATVTNGTVFNVNLGAGTFDFEPAAGFTGTATVSYTVSDTGCPGPAATSAPATISITVSGPVIWFVNPALGSNGDGRLSNPFNVLSSANTAKGTTVNHRIFVFTGTTTGGTGVSLAGDGALATAQWLIGQGATGGSFDALMGITPPAGTIARPSIGGTRPTIQGTLTLNGNNVKAQGFNLSTGTSTGVNDAVSAISGVSVSEVSVTTGAAAAVTLSNTGGVFSFQSITSVGGTVPGITLTSTTGSFTVTGNGGTCTTAGSCTGGSISAKTGASEATGTPGVRLFSVENVRLNYMNISGNNHSGIYGGSVANPSGVIDSSTINGFQLGNCNIEANGDTGTSLPDEVGVDLYNLVGTAIGGSNPTSITNTIIKNNFEFELQITNTTSTALTDLQMSGNALSSDGFQPSHGNLFNFLALGGANMTLNLTSGTFTGNTDTSGGKIVTATGVQCDHSGTGGTMTCNVSNATFTNNNVGPQASVSNGGNMVADFNNVVATGNRSQGVNFFVAASYTGAFAATLQNSTIGTLGTAGSASALGFGVRLQNEGVSTGASVKLRMNNTTVQETASFNLVNVNQGIAAQTSSTPSNVTLTNNILRNSGARAIVVQQNNNTDADSAGSTCVDISGNTMSNIPGQVGDGTYIRLRRLDANGSGHTFRVRQTSLADLAAQNSITTGQLAIGGTMTYNGGACLVP